MKTSTQRKGGRPLRPAVPGARVSLGLKVTPEIKTKLDEATRITGRTQSAEAEARLEQSFARDEAFGGAEARQVAMLMAAAFAVAGMRKGKELKAKDWAHDGGCYVAGFLSVVDALMTHPPRPLTRLEVAALHSRIDTQFANMGGNDAR
jgi:hypothetical protein